MTDLNKVPPCSGYDFTYDSMAPSQEYDPFASKDHGEALGAFDYRKAPNTLLDGITKSEAALRHNEGKAELSYILDFPRAVEALCRVMEHGHRHKYPRNNWKKGGKPDQEYYDSAMRHIYKDRNGEYFDSESGQLHIAHAIWNLMVLLEKNRKFSTEGTKCSPT